MAAEHHGTELIHLDRRARRGRLVGVGQALADAPGVGVLGKVTSYERGNRHVATLAQLLDAGTLEVPIQQTYGLDQAGEALGALGAGHTQGKLALQVA
jgi:NADPH:quinone reductase-like Zn-dependent oxidoreductase